MMKGFDDDLMVEINGIMGSILQRDKHHNCNNEQSQLERVINGEILQSSTQT